MSVEGPTYDALRIYDGNSSEANLLAEVIAFHYNVKVSSTGSQMFITFDSDKRSNWVGFHATFQEITVAPLNEAIKACSKDNPCHAGEGQCWYHKQCAGSLKCGYICPPVLGYPKPYYCCFDYCGLWLDMENGVITSPQYPDQYNNFEECIWTISAKENQTVLLHFLEFEVS